MKTILILLLSCITTIGGVWILSFIDKYVKKYEMARVILLSYTWALTFIFLFSQTAFKEKNDRIDYNIELDNDYGVIINNDTIELHQLEEYIEIDNL